MKLSILKKMLAILIFFLPLCVFAQENRMTRTFANFGVGFTSGKEVAADGSSIGLGVETQIINKRTRFLSAFAFGTYDTEAIQDVGSSFVATKSFLCNLNYDLVRINSFSIVVGSGLTYRHSKVFRGSGGDVENSKVYYPYFIKENNLAINGNLGFRYANDNNKLALELSVFSFSLNPFTEEGDLTVGQLKLAYNFTNPKEKL